MNGPALQIPENNNEPEQKVPRERIRHLLLFTPKQMLIRFIGDSGAKGVTLEEILELINDHGVPYEDFLKLSENGTIVTQRNNGEEVKFLLRDSLRHSSVRPDETV